MIIHIGAPKSASTTLQHKVFANTEHLYHFGEFGDGTTSIEDDLVIRGMFNYDDEFYSPDDTQQIIDKHCQIAGDRKIVFSSADVLIFNRPKLAASRLKAHFGLDVKILLIVRNQFDALVSYYAAHGAWLKPAPKPYFRAFVSFTEWIEYQKLHLSDSRLRTFSYWEQISPFRQVFGDMNVHVVLFEDLVNKIDTSWGILGELFDAREGDLIRLFHTRKMRERPSKRQLSFGRLLSLLIPIVEMPDIRYIGGPIGRFLSKGGSYSVNLSESQRRFLDNYFAEGNSKLADVFRLNLAAHGYPGWNS